MWVNVEKSIHPRISSDLGGQSRAANNFWIVAGHVDRPNQF